MPTSSHRGPRLAAVSQPGDSGPAHRERQPLHETIDLRFIALSPRIGLERTTFQVDMLSPILAALQPAEHLRIAIGYDPVRRRLETSLGGRFTGLDRDQLGERATRQSTLLANIAGVQLPGFRTRTRRQVEPLMHIRTIVPRGRPLPMAAVPGQTLGPRAVASANDDALLLLPPLGLAPERLMAAAQILASESRAMRLTLQLRLVPLDARTRKLIEEARETAEGIDAQTHVAAIRQAADIAAHHRYLNQLLLDGQGVEVVLVVEADGAIDETLAAMLSFAVFGAPAQTLAEREAASPLASLYPAEQALPALVTGLALTAAFSFQKPQRNYEAAEGPGLHLGTTADGDPVRIAEIDRAQHVFAIGATGTGKSTLLLNQMIADMMAGKGFILVDPHGDLFEAVLAAVPAHRRGDVITGALGDPKHPFTMNILEGLGGDPAIERIATINGLIRLFVRTLWADVDAFGPIFETYFRNAMLLLLEAKGSEASILEFERVFQDDDFRRELLDKCENQAVRDFWTKTVAEMTYRDWSLENLNVYVTSKLSPFLSNPLMRAALGATTSSFDLPAAIAGGKIVLLNLAKGIVGEGSARLMGGMVTMRLIASVQTQGRLPEAKRRGYIAYLDEFQTYATEHISEAMAEVRKYKLSLVLACQSLGQIDGNHGRSDVGRAIVANVANLISFRLGVADAAILAPWFAPDVAPDELMFLPNYQAVARLLVNGEALRPVEFRGHPPLHLVG